MATAARSPEAYQEQALTGVSRTFALTIPQLPRALQGVVTNAYLLCRIADTVEDEPAMDAATKADFHNRFVEVVSRCSGAQAFAAALAPLLSDASTVAERDLVRHLAEVVEVTRAFNYRQRQALAQCISVMCDGMPRYERNASISGLPDQRALDDYCYYVAGVVGDMLTTLFCDYSPAIARHETAMRPLGVCFGQGLQMVNILKDFWEDHDRGVCWLPHPLFADHGVELAEVDCDCYQPGFGRAYGQLIALARERLLQGFEYTLLIPPTEPGVRRFCLLALALALQTLTLIRQKPHFSSGTQVKVSRATVANSLLMTRLLCSYDDALRRWFQRLSRELPRQAEGADTDRVSQEG